MTETSSNHSTHPRPRKNSFGPSNQQGRNTQKKQAGPFNKSHKRGSNDAFDGHASKNRSTTGRPHAGKGNNEARPRRQEDWKSGFGSKTPQDKKPRTGRSDAAQDKPQFQKSHKPSVKPNAHTNAKQNPTAKPVSSEERTGFSGRISRPRKSSSRATPARLVALEATRSIRERNAYAQEVINHTIDHSSLTPEDRAFATRLVLGVVSTQGALDYVIDKTLDDPHDISPQVRDALRISTYEILFLDKLYHAAVDQGVELVKSVAPPAAGVANYALRSIVRMRPEFPFGDPRTDLDALSLLYGFPSWITILLMSDLGPETMLAFMKESNEPAPLFLAINHLKTRDELILRTFDRLEETLTPVSIEGNAIAGCYKVEDPHALLIPEVKRLFKQGRLMVTDATSQWVAQNVLPDEKPTSFLEVGAGRATKTILIQNEAQRRWGSQIDEYVTVDNHEFKTNILKDRVEQFDVHVAQALTADALHLEDTLGDKTFDAVFVDAPCSGFGTLRRHPEIRWRLTADDVVSLAKTQLALLKALAPHVAPNGTLSYATCTVTHLENNKVVKAFLDSDEGKDFQLVPIANKSCIATKLEPGSPDAHFAVKFQRIQAPNTTQDDAACETKNPLDD